MLTACLIIIYNKGQLHDKGNVKWLSEEVLYQKLNFVDPELPKEPPKGKSSQIPEGLTTDIASLLSQFVADDYLVSKTVKSATNDVTSTLCYAVGPRSALELGRRQLVHLAAQLIDELPDQAMLNELDNEEAGEPEEDEEEEAVEAEPVKPKEKEKEAPKKSKK